MKISNKNRYFSVSLDKTIPKGGSMTAATSKMELFVIIVNG